MSDDEGPSIMEDTGEGWVTTNGAQWSTRRVPGIDDVQETTYVPPPARLSRRTLIVGGAIALGSIAVAVGLVLMAGSGEDPRVGPSELNAAVTLTSSSTRAEPTTTTTSETTVSSSPADSTSSQAGITSPTTAAVASVSEPAAAPAPVPPRATADPAKAPYQPVAVPKGVSATLGACTWQPVNGGQLQAAGTITSASASNRHWTLTMHWLQNSRELAQQSGTVDLAPSEAKSWTLTLAAPNPPADLACSLEIK